MFIFFFFSSALSSLHLYNEPKFRVSGNPVTLEQSHAHNAPDLWDRGSRPNSTCRGVLLNDPSKITQYLIPDGKLAQVLLLYPPLAWSGISMESLCNSSTSDLWNVP